MSVALTLAPEVASTIPVRKPQEIRVVSDPIAVLDTARFEHMQRIASVMARSNLIPEALCTTKDGDGKKVYLRLEEVTANCFLVVNQAVRWNMDPFAVAQCVSVVHGKLCYEGKLIAAVLESKLGYQLEYDITGVDDDMTVTVMATLNGKPVLDSKGNPKVVRGSVGEWKTTGANSPWSARGGQPRMLRYRGAREWARVHHPGIMLGVYSDDEMEDLNSSHRARLAPSIVPDGPPAPPPVAQVEHQPKEPVNTVPVSGPVEDLVEVKAGGGETIEWSDDGDAAGTVSASADQPPVPPAPSPAGTKSGEVEDFPGDRPLAPANDGLDIPPYLRRETKVAPQPAESGEPFDVEEWLSGLSDELAGCEGLEELTEIQQNRVTPLNGKVAKADFARALTLIMETFDRISGVGEGE